jgi:dephospho-CoA kinase
MSDLEQLTSEIASAQAECYGAVAKYLLDHSGTVTEADQAVVRIAETTAAYSDALERLIQYLKNTEIDEGVITRDAIEKTVGKANEKRRALQRLQMRAAKRMK